MAKINKTKDPFRIHFIDIANPKHDFAYIQLLENWLHLTITISFATLL